MSEISKPPASPSAPKGARHRWWRRPERAKTSLTSTTSPTSSRRVVPKQDVSPRVREAMGGMLPPRRADVPAEYLFELDDTERTQLLGSFGVDLVEYVSWRHVTREAFEDVREQVERFGWLDLSDDKVRPVLDLVVRATFAQGTVPDAAEPVDDFWREKFEQSGFPRLLDALRAAEMDVRAGRLEPDTTVGAGAQGPEVGGQVPVEGVRLEVAGAGLLSRLLADPQLAQAQRQARRESWSHVLPDHYEFDPEDLGPVDESDGVLREDPSSRRERAVRRLEHVKVAARFEALVAYLGSAGRFRVGWDAERAPWRTAEPPLVPPVRDVEVDWVLADDPRLVPLVMERAMEDDYVCRGLTRELQASWPSSSLLAAAALGAVWARGHDGAGPIPADVIRAWGQEIAWAHDGAGVQGSLLRSICQDVAEGLPPEQMGAAIREGAALAREVGLPAERADLDLERFELSPDEEWMFERWSDPGGADLTV